MMTVAAQVCTGYDNHSHRKRKRRRKKEIKKENISKVKNNKNNKKLIEIFRETLHLADVLLFEKYYEDDK